MPTNLEKIAEMRRKFRNCMVFIEPRSIDSAHADFDALLSAIAEESDRIMNDSSSWMDARRQWCELAKMLRGEEKK